MTKINDEHRCFCELAPLYALDLLDIEERLWVEAQVVEYPELAEELASYHTTVGLLPYSAAPVPMAADLKDRLFARLAVRDSDRLGLVPPIDEPEISPELAIDRQQFALRSQDLQWFPLYSTGMEFALLFTDPIDRMRSVVVRAAVAGLGYPQHRHARTEEIYMLEGTLTIDGETYSAGDYIRSTPGSVHTSTMTVTACKFLIRASMDDEYF